MTEDNFLTSEEQELLNRTLEEVHQEIPVNSKTLLINDVTSRFSSAIWYEFIQKQNVLLAGIGGIGSYVAYLLSRVNCHHITLFDPDKVEVVNMSGQFYGSDSIGSYKVDALIGMLYRFSNYYSVNGVRRKYEITDSAWRIMICGFDNMKARKLFFNNWLKGINKANPDEYLFIDGRLAAEEFQIFCIRGDDEYNIKRYQEEFLFTDEEADETLCSYKQTSFCANMIASYMVNLFVNFCANHCDPLIERDLPFYTSYNAETMFLKTEK